MTLNDWGTLVAVVAGCIGATLGITNLFFRILEKRARVRVVPKIAFDAGDGMVLTGDRPTNKLADYIKAGRSIRLCIEVTNLSEFPITVDQVGFKKKGNVENQFYFVIPEITPPTKSWPTRLESRESFTAYANPNEGLEDLPEFGPLAFCTTDCGCTFYGTSTIIKHLIAGTHMQNKVS